MLRATIYETEMILLLPYTRFEFTSRLTVSETSHRLESQTDPRSIWGGYSFLNRNKPKPFSGRVEESKFNINRTIRYRNSFLPVIVGQFHDDLDRTRITITMRLHHLVTGFLVFLPLFFMATVLGIGFGSGELGDFLLGGAMTGGFMLFFYLIIMLFFNYEAKKARRMLAEMWEVNEPGF